MTAADVAATFNRLADPENKSNSLSVFQGVLNGGGVSAPDETTVVFELEAPNGSWPLPRLLGQLQRDHAPGELRPETGRHLHRHRALEARLLHAQGRGAPRRATRTTGAKSRPPRPRRDHLLRRRGSAHVLACSGKQVDASTQIGIAAAGRSSTTRTTSRSSGSTARPTESSRCGATGAVQGQAGPAGDRADPRPPGDHRQALRRGTADLGNDSPFAPVFAATDKYGATARARTSSKAKQLIADAGVPNGF